MWEMRSESAHDHCLVGFVFKRATHSIPCSSAGGYQTVLHYCGRPLLDWEWVACIRRKASCTEPRGPYRDGSGRIHLPGNPYILDMTLWLSVKLLWNCVLWKRWINQSNLIFSAVFSRFFSLCVTVNGNGHSIGALNKHSPESGSSWLEEGCNGFGPLRFSSPGSGLSGISSSILSATSESALSGYSTERSLLSPNSTYSALSCWKTTNRLSGLFINGLGSGSIFPRSLFP